jgi:hypothetical protein
MRLRQAALSKVARPRWAMQLKWAAARRAARRRRVAVPKKARPGQKARRLRRVAARRAMRPRVQKVVRLKVGKRLEPEVELELSRPLQGVARPRQVPSSLVGRVERSGL